MIYTLKIGEACTSILGLIFFVREIIKIGLILLPIGLILMLTIDFSKGTIGNHEDGKNADTKKIPSIIIRRIIYIIVIFLIPISIYGILRTIGLNAEANNSESCWRYIDNKDIDSVKKEIEKNQKEVKEETEKMLDEIVTNSNVNTSNKDKIRTIVSK